MTGLIAFTPIFRETIPQLDDMEQGMCYVSIPHTTAVHLCMCGCGSEVVTPIRPDGWQLTYNGEQVSLKPSIGSWRLPCRSHYLLRDNRVYWLPTPEAADEERDVATIGARVLEWLRRHVRLSEL